MILWIVYDKLISSLLVRAARNRRRHASKVSQTQWWYKHHWFFNLPRLEKIGLIGEKMKALLALIVLLLSSQSFAACRWAFIDHDFNTSTPAIRQQICDNTLDVPAIKPPAIQPIQQPQIRPLQPLVIPPIGTTRCRNVSVYEDGRWVTRQVCS